MAGAGIDLDVVIDLVLVEGLAEGTAGAGCEVLLGVRAHDGTHSLDDLDPPWVGGVEGRDRLEPVIGACPRDRKAAPHAEADGADAMRIDVRHDLRSPMPGRSTDPISIPVM